MTTQTTTRKRRKTLRCPDCGRHITSAEIASFIARQGAGRKPELQPCPYECGESFGTAEMRYHIPRCEKNPDRRFPNGR
jgi:hypothetical protein